MIYASHKVSVQFSGHAEQLTTYASVAKPYLITVCRKDICLKLVPFAPPGKIFCSLMISYFDESHLILKNSWKIRQSTRACGTQPDLVVVV